MGGKAFPDVEPILKDEYSGIIHAFLETPVGNDYCQFIGSSRFNRSKSYNDIDMLVEVTDQRWDEILSQMGSMFETKKINKRTVSVRFPFKGRYYQFDLMQSRSIPFSELAYQNDNTIYKGVFRNVLIEAMIKTLSEKTIIKDIARTRSHMDLYDGLVLLVQKKTPKAKRYETVQRIILEPDYMKALRSFIPKINKTDIESYEALCSFLVDHYYSIGAEKIWFDIVKEYVEILESIGGLTIPENIKVWRATNV